MPFGELELKNVPLNSNHAPVRPLIVTNARSQSVVIETYGRVSGCFAEEPFGTSSSSTQATSILVSKRVSRHAIS